MRSNATSREDKNMHLISTFLTLAAIFSSVVGIGFLVIWLRGIDSILLPGPGVLLATPLIVLLILIVEVVLVLLAMITKAASVSA
jgi:hypothetical protein